VVLGATELGAQTLGPALPELRITKQEIRIPMAQAGSAGLQAWLLVPSLAGRHPLAILTPDTNWSDKAAKQMGPGMLQPEALWFLHRGWAVAIVLRRGMGRSGGAVPRGAPTCGTPSMETTGDADAPDLAAAVNYLSLRSEIDPAKVIVVGEGMGGTGAVSLGLRADANVKAVVSVSGWWNTLVLHGWTCKNHLPTTFGDLSSRRHAPMLWIYSEHDAPIGQKSIVTIHDAFVAAGGSAELSLLHNTRNDKFSFAEAPELWGRVVEAFLARHDLPATQVFADAHPSLQKLPGQVPESMQNAFLHFQKLGPFKAFAVGLHGEWGYSTGKTDLSTAEHEALDLCGTPIRPCKIVARSTD